MTTNQPITFSFSTSFITIQYNTKGLLTEREVCTVKYRAEVFFLRIERSGCSKSMRCLLKSRSFTTVRTRYINKLFITSNWRLINPSFREGFFIFYVCVNLLIYYLSYILFWQGNEILCDEILCMVFFFRKSWLKTIKMATICPSRQPYIWYPGPNSASYPGAF